MQMIYSLITGKFGNYAKYHYSSSSDIYGVQGDMLPFYLI